MNLFLKLGGEDSLIDMHLSILHSSVNLHLLTFSIHLITHDDKECDRRDTLCPKYV